MEISEAVIAHWSASDADFPERPWLPVCTHVKRNTRTDAMTKGSCRQMKILMDWTTTSHRFVLIWRTTRQCILEWKGMIS